MSLSKINGELRHSDIVTDTVASEDSVHINSLPHEILEYIFSFLTITQRIQTERVCKRWRLIGENWQFPCKLILDDRGKIKKSQQISYCYSATQIPDNILAAILSRCGTCLKQLTLGSWVVNSPWVSTSSLEVVAKYCPNLVEIRLYAVPLQENLKILAAGCKTVKSVKLGGYPAVTDEELVRIVEGWKYLECLDVFASLSGVKGDCFERISERLRILRMSSCPCLQPASLEIIRRRCHSIEELHLPCCDLINVTNLAELFYHYKDSLRILNLAWYTKDLNECGGIMHLFNLKDLNISDCVSVNDEFCRKLSLSCLQLTRLDISGTKVTDLGLSYLASATSLTELDVSRTLINGEGIEILAKSGILQVLVAQLCKHIPEGSRCFYALTQFCPNFRALVARSTEGISRDLLHVFRKSFDDGFFKSPVCIKVCGDESKNTEICSSLVYSRWLTPKLSP